MTRVCAIAIVSLVSAVLVAQTPAPPVFRFERPVVVTGNGPHRLAVDVALLAGAAPGLRDVRFYDVSGREVGYLLVGNPPSEPQWAPATILPVAPTETRTSRTSGFEADLGQPTPVDRVRLNGLPAPFLKRVKLEGSGDREHWTLLVADGSLFDLPADRLQQTELRFTPGAFRYLRVTWDDTNSGRLPHPSAVQAARQGPVVPPPALSTPLAFERRTGEPGRSHFRVRLPGGRMPIASLAFAVAGGHILREASAFEARLSGGELAPVLLGRTALRRVVAGDVTAAALLLPLMAPPIDSQLDLVFDDGNNPPLELRGITAIFAEQPWIYFEAPAGSLTARYGNPTIGSPSYDIEALRDRIRIGDVPDASWGEARAPQTSDAQPGSAPALPTVGSTLDVALFRYIRPLPAGAAGLVAVPLDASVLAHSAGASAAFADVRVVDAEGRQVPYILERATEPLSLAVTLERAAAAPKTLPANTSVRSIYRIAWPDASLPDGRLVLSTSARVFNRRITLGVERAPDARRRDRWMDVVGRATWVHADQDQATPVLPIPVPRLNASELFVIVEEGDNAPLPLGETHILLPSYRLRLFRDANAALRVVYGRAEQTRPQYDLALLAPQVLGTPATDVVLAAEPAAATDRSKSALLSPRIFWVSLGLAAVVLLGLIARLLAGVQPTAKP